MTQPIALICAVALLSFTLVSAEMFLPDAVLPTETSDPIVEYNNPTYDPTFAKEMVYASGLSYCSIKSVEKWKCGEPCKNLPNWTLYFAAESPKDSTLAFFVLINDQTKQITFAFRGTHAVDQLADEVIKGTGENYATQWWKVPGVQVLTYFANKYQSVLESQVASNLQALGSSSRKNYQFIFTGHSLGGALATLASIDAVTSGYIPVTTSSPYLITYGSPRVGNYQFAQLVSTMIPVMFRVTHYNDIVPHVPFCAGVTITDKCKAPSTSDALEDSNVEFLYWYGYHVKQEIWYNELNTKYTVCSQTDSEDPHCSDGLLIYDVTAHLDYLGLGIATMCADPFA